MRLLTRNYHFILCIFIFIPIFIGFSSSGIYLNILGKFDPIFRSTNITVVPLNFFILLIIFIISKPFKIDKKLILLNLSLLAPMLISVFLIGEINIRLFKISLGLFLFFNGYHIFCKFNKNFKSFEKYIIFIFYTLLTLLVVNLISALNGNISSLIIKKIQIYSYFDYYPMIFFPFLILVINYLKKNLSIYFILIYFVLAVYLLFISQSRIVLLSSIVITLLFIFYYSNSIFENIFNNKLIFYLSLSIIILFYFFIVFSFLILNNKFATANTLSYRMYEIIEYAYILNIKNILLPQLEGNVSESFHNQFIDIYNWLGIFSIYVIYYFKIIVDKSFSKNPGTTFIKINYLIIIFLFLLPLTHVYTSIIFAYLFSLLSYKNFELKKIK